MSSSSKDRMSEVETPAVIGPWKKSSRSNTLQNLNCVELAPTTAGRAIRDSKDVTGGVHAGPVLHFSENAISGLLGLVRSGAVDFGLVDAAA